MIWLFRRVSSAPSGLRGWRSLHIATGDGCQQSERKRSGTGQAPSPGGSTSFDLTFTEFLTTRYEGRDRRSSAGRQWAPGKADPRLSP